MADPELFVITEFDCMVNLILIHKNNIINIHANQTSTLMSKVVQKIKEKSSPTHALALNKKIQLEDVLFAPHLTCLK